MVRRQIQLLPNEAAIAGGQAANIASDYRRKRSSHFRNPSSVFEGLESGAMPLYFGTVSSDIKTPNSETQFHKGRIPSYTDRRLFARVDDKAKHVNRGLTCEREIKRRCLEQAEFGDERRWEVRAGMLGKGS